MRLIEGGQSIAAVARTPGPVDQTLFNWVKARRIGKLKVADSKPVSVEQMEISRLKAELAREDGARHLWKSDGVLRKGIELKYSFIQRHRRVWQIAVQRRVLVVSVAGYHKLFVCSASAA